LFIVCVIGMMAIPFHVANLTAGVKGGTGAVSPLVFVGVPVGVVVGVVAVVVPLRAGGRSLRGMEF